MKRLTTLALLSCFLLSCASGLLLGLLVRTPPYPSAATIPLYPGAQAVVDRGGKIAGVGSPTPPVAGNQSTGFVDFQFTTGSAPTGVLAFYNQELAKRYGFQVSRVDNPAPGVTVVRFVRDIRIRHVGPFTGPNGELITYGGWDKEFVTLTMTAELDGLTTVDGKLEFKPYTP